METLSSYHAGYIIATKGDALFPADQPKIERLRLAIARSAIDETVTVRAAADSAQRNEVLYLFSLQAPDSFTAAGITTDMLWTGFEEALRPTDDPQVRFVHIGLASIVPRPRPSDWRKYYEDYDHTPCYEHLLAQRNAFSSIVDLEELEAS